MGPQLPQQELEEEAGSQENRGSGGTDRVRTVRADSPLESLVPMGNHCGVGWGRGFQTWQGNRVGGGVTEAWAWLQRTQTQTLKTRWDSMGENRDWCPLTSKATVKKKTTKNKKQRKKKKKTEKRQQYIHQP